jgi:hypothetical protein
MSNFRWIRWSFAAAVTTCVLVAGVGAWAADIPSCYDAVRVARPDAPADVDLYVLIDQTVLLDDSLRRSVLDNVTRVITPNTNIAVIKFSAFSQGRYLDVVFRGGAEPSLSKAARNAVGARTLSRLDTCLTGQLAFAKRRTYETTKASMDGSSGSLARSDILASLKEVSQATNESRAHRRIVLVVSDMLENSSISSFYRKNGLRLIDPKAETAKAQAANMIGNFHDAEVYIIGGALMGDSGTGYGPSKGVTSYRDPVSLDHLQAFWTEFFQLSNARLIEFGVPALIKPIN